jgi:RNA polymerase sigma-70 factor (ECF subfamily)
VVGYAVRRCSDRADAADAVAETYLVLWRRLDEAPRGESLLPWLYGVTRKVLANQRRGSLRQSSVVTRLADELQTLPLLPGPEPSQRAQLQRAFATLSAADRELLSLVSWERLSRDELAVALGISRAAVRVRLHRARQRFAQALAHEGVEIPTSATHSSTTSPSWPLLQEVQP